MEAEGELMLWSKVLSELVTGVGLGIKVDVFNSKFADYTNFIRKSFFLGTQVAQSL